MPQNKPLNFAQALRSKPGRPPEPDEDATSHPSVDAHISKGETPTLNNVDVQQSNQVDAHFEQSKTPTQSNVGRPQQVEPDARTRSVDANAPTQLPSVDAKPPTPRRGGRPQKRAKGAHKSDRHRGDLVRQHFRIPPELDERFRLFRAQKNLDLQEFYQMAGAHFIESVDAHEGEQVDALASHDDRDLMIMFKTHPLIINLYLQYNPENRWKPADDYEGRRYNEKDIRLIEVGIIQTQFNARFKKINSFKYYRTEIDIALETPLTDETIEIMLKHSRRRWEASHPSSTKPA